MRRNFLTLFFIPAALLVAFNVLANQHSVESITVDLVLDSTKKKEKTGTVSATLVIRNMGSTEVKVAHPGSRMAVAFIVMNSLGNVVSPVGIAKVDPPFGEMTIKPNSEFKQSFPNLEFITGSALFGYELKSGETYRVVAIYRPNGEKSPGITTGEQIITVK
jgi:hypothetical protein